MENFEKNLSFARAAKDAGFNEDERRMIAEEPELLLEGVNEKFKDLTAEELKSFFDFLQGNKENHESALKIGQLLYGHRDIVKIKEETEYNEYGHEVTKVSKSVEEGENLNDQDCRLINLACNLIEDSFYKGKLLDVKEEKGASMAFTVNILAKILAKNKNDERLNGFDEKKLEEFLHNVQSYERETLYAETPAAGKLEMDGKAAVNSINEIILRLIRSSQDLGPKIEEDKSYFYDTAKRLSEIYEALVAGGVYRVNSVTSVSMLIEGLQNPEMVMDVYINEARKIREDVMSEKEESRQRHKLMENPIYHALFVVSWNLYYQNKSEEGGEEKIKDRSWGSFCDTRDMIKEKKFEKKIETGDGKKGEKKKFSSLEGLNDLRNRGYSKQLQAAMEDLKKMPSGPIGEYIKNYREIINMARRRMYIKKMDIPFAESYDSIESKKTRKDALSYIIKTCLIVRDIEAEKSYIGDKIATREIFKEASESDDFYNSQTYLKKSQEEKKLTQAYEEGVGVHSFKKDANSDRYWRGGGHAELHYIVNELPFAVWANRYIHSKQKEKKA
jgi:hypothetical protein